MTTDPSSRAEQIQANVAAALSRLRGEPVASAPSSPQPSPQAQQALAGDQADQVSTETEPPFSVGAVPAGIGAPDPGMALSSHDMRAHEGQPSTPFERLTGLTPAGLSPNNLDPDDQPDLLQGIGVPPPPLADLPDPDSEEVRRKRRLRNRLIVGGAALVLLGGFWLLTDSPEGEVPVITADGTPERVKPEDEGGLSVPNQDVAILNEGAQVSEGETVLPAPEQPAPPPAPAVVAETPSETTTPATVATAPEPTSTEIGAAPAIPSVSAPDVAAIPSVPAPTELGTSAPAAAAVPDAVEPPATAAAPETASAATAIPKVTAAIQPVPGGTARIQLASVKSAEGARQEWSRLQKAHPAILGGLDLHVEKFEKSAGEVYYRVQAGPLGDKASAKQICADLKKKNQACIVAN